PHFVFVAWVKSPQRGIRYMQLAEPQLAPVSRGDERRPVAWVVVVVTPSRRKRGPIPGAHGAGGGAPAAKSCLIQARHERLGGSVLNRPETHDQRRRAGDAKRAPQPENPLVDFDLAEA